MPGCPRSVKLAREQRGRVLPSHSRRERGMEASRALWSALVRAEAESDLEFVCGDGTSVLCDQLVLALASTFLHKLILGNCVRTGDDRLRPQKLTVCLPDVSSEGVRGLLSVLYNGFTEFPQPSSHSTTANQIKTAFKVLKIDVVQLKDRERVRVEKFSEFCLTSQYQNRKSFDTHEQEKVRKGDSIDLVQLVEETRNKISSDKKSSAGEILELEEESPQTPVRPPQVSPKLRSEWKAETPKPTCTPDISSSRKRKSSVSSSQSTKTRKIEVSYSVQQVHTCLICNGKTPEGRVDKEAIDLSFAEAKRLKEHYSKHFYNEGKILKAFPPDEKNLDSKGKIIDQFGRQFKYRCTAAGCWKAKKAACGYKEMALHEAADHGLWERIAAEDERPEVRRLVQQITKPL